MDIKPFSPANQGTFYIANAVAASTPVALTGGDQVVLFNSSSTAIAFVRIASYPSNSDSIVSSTATVPGTTAATAGSFAVPPLAQIRITCGQGHKSISAIASAADGNLYVTPGHGN